MKHYSKNQLIITTLIAVFFSASITSIFFILNQNKTDKNIEAAIKVSKFQNKNEELITFEQNVPETTAIPVSSENTYTQEELQNINVYEIFSTHLYSDGSLPICFLKVLAKKERLVKPQSVAVSATL